MFILIHKNSPEMQLVEMTGVDIFIRPENERHSIIIEKASGKQIHAGSYAAWEDAVRELDWLDRAIERGMNCYEIKNREEDTCDKKAQL